MGKHACYDKSHDAKKVINSKMPTVMAFSEDQSAEIRDRIFDEFNTLAVVYRQPSYAFVQQASTVEQDQFAVSHPPSPQDKVECACT